MTLAEYMSPERFPLTSQPGLRPQQQLMIDAMNHDELAQAKADGALLTPDEEARLAELTAKASGRAAVAREAGAPPAPPPGAGAGR